MSSCEDRHSLILHLLETWKAGYTDIVHRIDGIKCCSKIDLYLCKPLCYKLKCLKQSIGEFPLQATTLITCHAILRHKQSIVTSLECVFDNIFLGDSQA
jgi:hypothetical protein